MFPFLFSLAGCLRFPSPVLVSVFSSNFAVLVFSVVILGAIEADAIVTQLLQAVQLPVEPDDNVQLPPDDIVQLPPVKRFKAIPRVKSMAKSSDIYPREPSVGTTICPADSARAMGLPPPPPAPAGYAKPLSVPSKSVPACPPGRF